MSKRRSRTPAGEASAASATPAGKAMTVADASTSADRYVEMAALVRAVRDEVVPKFAPMGRNLPELLLRRGDMGVRPASVDAIVDVECELETLARRFDETAARLYGARVTPLEGQPRHLPVVDTVVSQGELESLLPRPSRPDTGS